MSSAQPQNCYYRRAVVTGSMVVSGWWSPVLSRFGMTDDALLGAGGESRVYELSPDRVLRVMSGTQADELLARAFDVSRLLDNGRQAVPFAVPEVLDGGVEAGVPFTVERRIPGRALGDVLEEFVGSRRETVLYNYAVAVKHLRRIAVPSRFGGLWDTRSTWSETVVARAEEGVARAGPALVGDVPELEEVMADFRRRASALDDDLLESHLVHGDYFPGNVLVDDDLEVSGVVDFGGLSMLGDARADEALAAAYLGIRHSIPDVIYVRSVLPLPDDIFSFYSCFAALRLSFTRRLSPKLYAWCVTTLSTL